MDSQLAGHGCRHSRRWRAEADDLHGLLLSLAFGISGLSLG